MIPSEATQAVHIVEELIGRDLAGMYLFGSALVGGLRADSDIDVLAVSRQSLSTEARAQLVARLMTVSGKIGNARAVRPLEVTVVRLDDVASWRYPPFREFLYGEWLRDRFEQGFVPGREADPDLAIVLTTVRESSLPLRGPPAEKLLAPIPRKDLFLALRESLPSLLGGLQGDERNVLLTLARMWRTAATGEIVPKDVAAGWAIDLLPEPQARTLDVARRAYLGDLEDDWSDQGDPVAHLVEHMTRAIEVALRNGDRNER